MDKIAIIDHSYHKKTKSSSFIEELLIELYELEVLYDDSWNGGKKPDLSMVNDQYKAVIFWQRILPETFNTIKCKNIIFFPMYDDSGGEPDEFWYRLRGIKIISFSKTLYDRLYALGMQVFYVQYFPKEDDFIHSSDNSVFFWHRRFEITWNTVEKLLRGQKIDSVHIHRAIDPFQIYVPPTDLDEDLYNITYSDWFATKADYLSIVKQKSIYIAPRVFEGIGFSFLEAMAMGKAVVAADNPTMNEYIIHGVNGYLFSPDNPHPIDFSNLDQVRANAYKTIVEGRKRWEEEKHEMLKFIEAQLSHSVGLEVKYQWNIMVFLIKKKIKNIVKNILPYGIVRLYQIYKK